MKINDMAAPAGADIYYDPSFRAMLEDHMTFLRNHSETQTIEISDHDAYKWEGDLSGLLSKYNVDRSLHWVVMRMNNFVSPADNKDTLKLMLIPSIACIDRLRSVYVTQNKIKS